MDVRPAATRSHVVHQSRLCQLRTWRPRLFNGANFTTTVCYSSSRSLTVVPCNGAGRETPCLIGLLPSREWKIKIGIKVDKSRRRFKIILRQHITCPPLVFPHFLPSSVPPLLQPRHRSLSLDVRRRVKNAGHLHRAAIANSSPLCQVSEAICNRNQATQPTTTADTCPTMPYPTCETRLRQARTSTTAGSI